MMMDKINKTSGTPVGEIDWGSLRAQEPVSDKWGFDRGLPIDRYYIEKFLQTHFSDIKGYCLEVMNGMYTKRFGANVTGFEVLDVNKNNKNATIVGDLTDPATLTPNTFDCFIMTQTLPVIYDGNAVIKNSYAALKPGGVLLITAPALCRYSPHPEDYWRFTDKSLEQLILSNSDTRNFQIEKHGNLVCSIGFMIGAASQEMKQTELDYYDERFPIVITARLVKPEST
jgi:SAM-dependent methyltransferase